MTGRRPFRPVRLLVCLLPLLGVGCGGVPEETEPSGPPSNHLFERPASAVEVGGEVVPEDVAQALGGGVVWVRDVLPSRGSWQIDADYVAGDGPLRYWAPTRFPPVGPVRLVEWEHANVIDAGRVLGEDETVVPRVAEEFLITARGLEASVPEVGEFPPAQSISYPTTPAQVALLHLGIPPTPERIAEPRRTVLGRLSRRTAVAPAPTRIAWRVEVPAGAQLVCGYGLRSSSLEVADGGGVRILEDSPVREGDPGSVVFRVEVEGEELWSDELELDARDTFHDALVELGPFAGRSVEIALVTAAGPDGAGENVHAFWSEPVLDAPATTSDDGRPPPPDIVMIVVDTLRADELGCAGNPRDVSPNIDALAARGVRFSDVMAAASWTLPSHVSILSSLYPSEHGCMYRERMPVGLDALPEVLRAGGYTTLAVTEGMFVSPKFGLDQGFDHFETSGWAVKNTVRKAMARVEPLRGPYFLYLHTFQMHWPYASLPRWRERFVDPYDGPLEVPISNQDWTRIEGGFGPEDVRFIRQVYDAEMAYVDDELGKLLRKLDEDTLVVFTSDHGEAFDEHGTWGHGTTVYTEQLNVPLILAWPGRFEGGLVVDHPVHTIDIAPTLVLAAGLGVPSTWRGQPLSTSAGQGERDLFGGFLAPPFHRRTSVYRRGDVKVMQVPDDPSGRDSAWRGETKMMAFDLSRDPLELNDIWEEVRGRLDWEDLMPLWQRYPPLFEVDRSTIDDDLQDRLESLGYAGD